MSIVLPPSRVANPLDAPALRWAVLAPGGIAAQFARALQTHTRQRIVAVGSRSRQRAEAFAATFEIDRAYGSYEEAVADGRVQAVYVASPHTEHARQAIMAIEAGKHVLVEKPLAPTTREATRITDAAAAAGVLAMEAMWTRYLPHIDVLRRLLEAGEVGEIVLVSADFGAAFDFDPSGRIFNPALAGGGLLDVGVYASSFVSMVAGEPVELSVTGALAETGVDALATLAGRHAKGEHSVAVSTILAATPQHASVMGRRGRIDVHPPFWMPGGLSLTRGDQRGDWRDESPLRGHDGLAYEAAAFASYVSEGRTDSPLLPLAESVAVIRTLERARSALGSVGAPGEES